jgi:choice-of-anchor C domain-containing protein
MLTFLKVSIPVGVLMRSFGLILIASLAMASSAHAINVTNGSFEQGAAITGGFDLLAPGNTTAITGWTVLGPGGVDYADNNLWAASDGSRSVELPGIGTGGLSQVVTNQFVIGQKYVMRFDYTVNPFALDGNYGATVSVTGAGPVVFDYEKTAANMPGSMNYLTFAYNFTATSETKTIEFLSNGTGFLGIVIDNVSIAEAGVVPEPASWAMLLAGFGLTGAMMRRRRPVPAALR